jgi:Site-specific recombinase XerD
MATIRKRVNKSGEIVYTIQVKTKNQGSGTTIVQTTTWKPEEGSSQKKAERDAIIFADQFEKDVKRSVSSAVLTPDNPNITFREFCQKWLDRTKKEYSIVYYVKVRDCLELACDYIGGYKLKELNPAIIQSFYNKLDERKKTITKVYPKETFRAVLESYRFDYKRLRYELSIQSCTLANAYNGKTVSKGWADTLAQKTKIPFSKLFEVKTLQEDYADETTHQIKRTVRAVLSMAKKNMLIQDNYASADYINFPRKTPPQLEFMNDEEVHKFFDVLMNYPDIRIKTAMMILILTGFRRGELSGLEWGDIDFDKKTIKIQRALTIVKGYGVILKEPKTENSKRTISISNTLIDVLNEYRAYWYRQREECGDYIMKSDRLFTKEDGDRVNPGIFQHWLDKVLAEADLPHHTIHSLRHTNITLQIIAGVPITTVSARAGHARTSTTTDIYSYFLKSSDQQAADILDNVLVKKHKEED